MLLPQVRQGQERRSKSMSGWLIARSRLEVIIGRPFSVIRNKLPKIFGSGSIALLVCGLGPEKGLIGFCRIFVLSERSMV